METVGATRRSDGSVSLRGRDGSGYSLVEVHMYAIRDSEGHFVAKSHTRAGAHRRSRSRGSFAGSVNRAGSTLDPSSLKSERSAKILMTKMERRYEAARDERNSFNEQARQTGWSEEMFAEQRKAEVKMNAIVDEMIALSAAAHVRGWYVKGTLLRYWDSPTAALVAQNID
jgi:hypothetical protein